MPVALFVARRSLDLICACLDRVRQEEIRDPVLRHYVNGNKGDTR
jgi:hypothetical protein